MLSKLRELLQPIAPALTAALGGPYAGIAVRFLANKLELGDLGLEQEDVNQVLKKLGSSTKALEAAKMGDKEFELEMRKLEVDVFKLEVEDRKNARALSKTNILPHLTISGLFVVAYFMILSAVFWAEISPDFNPGAMWDKNTNEWVEQGESLLDLMHVLLGVLTAGGAQILNFWFGGHIRADKPTKNAGQDENA